MTWRVARVLVRNLHPCIASWSVGRRDKQPNEQLPPFSSLRAKWRFCHLNYGRSEISPRSSDPPLGRLPARRSSDSASLDGKESCALARSIGWLNKGTTDVRLSMEIQVVRQDTRSSSASSIIHKAFATLTGCIYQQLYLRVTSGASATC